MFDKMASNGKQPKSVSFPKAIDKLCVRFSLSWLLPVFSLHGVAPQYLGPFVSAADLPSGRALRLASTVAWWVPTFKRSAVSGRTFQVSGSRMWNELPEDAAMAPSLAVFRRRLKTSFFQRSYPDILMI